MLSTLRVARLAILQIFFQAVASLTPWDVTSDTFFRMLWHNSIIVDNWLYIDGGEYWLVGASSYADINHPPTLSIDLSSSWTNSTVTINQIEKPDVLSGNFTLIHEGMFWQESTPNSIVVFGGDSYNSTHDDFPIWELTVASGDGTWSQLYSATSSIFQQLVWPRNPVSSSNGLSLGGFNYTLNGTAAAVLRMTTIDTANNTFTTTDNIGPLSSLGSGIEEGGAHFVPTFGTGKGLVVAFGGQSLGNSTSDPEWWPMDTIYLFDLETQEWYSQGATADNDVDIPTNGNNFCVTGAQGTNTSTYEIFMMGASTGLGDTTTTDSGTVFILTLPAFRWIKAPATSLSRTGCTCHTIQNQMLVVGGFDPTSAEVYDERDPWTFGIGVFDLNALSWSSSYDSNAPEYVKADIVGQFYETHPLYPIWDNPKTETLFLQASTTDTPESTTTSPAPTQESGSAPKKSSSSTPIGAIIGGVLGGLGVLLLVIVAIWFFRRRAAERRESTEQQHQQIINHKQPLPVAEPVKLHDYRNLTELDEIHGASELGTDIPRHELDGGFQHASELDGNSITPEMEGLMYASGREK